MNGLCLRRRVVQVVAADCSLTRRQGRDALATGGGEVDELGSDKAGTALLSRNVLVSGISQTPTVLHRER